MSIALVTGASSGIGRALAAEAARRGYRVVLVARDGARLRSVADALPGGPHEVLIADLATPAGIAAVEERLRDERAPVDLYIPAAGAGTSAPFPRAPIAEELAMVDINVVAVLRTVHAAANAMAARGGGAIMTVASTAAYWSAGTYAAAKSWVLLMSLGLRATMSGSGVTVMALSPGFTRTEFHARSGTDASGVRPWLWLDADEVARTAFDDLVTERPVSVPGRRYRALVEAVRHLPPGGRARVLRSLAPLRSAKR
jgi:short-subunit dehydrogenase